MCCVVSHATTSIKHGELRVTPEPLEAITRLRYRRPQGPAALCLVAGCTRRTMCCSLAPPTSAVRRQRLAPKPSPSPLPGQRPICSRPHAPAARRRQMHTTVVVRSKRRAFPAFTTAVAPYSTPRRSISPFATAPAANPSMASAKARLVPRLFEEPAHLPQAGHRKTLVPFGQRACREVTRGFRHAPDVFQLSIECQTLSIHHLWALVVSEPYNGDCTH